jgi:prepilin-type N-terminal cleavage/methylation domain-containing protein
MRRLRTEERGFTLVEMLLTCVLGTIVLTAVLGLVDTAQRVTTNVTERTDTTQRGRLAMERMVQMLRSQVCLKLSTLTAQTTITDAQSTGVTFFADIPNQAEGTGATFKPDLRTLAVSNGKITQRVTGYVAPFDGATFIAAAPGTANVLASGIAQVTDSLGMLLPYFRYYAYKTDGNLDYANPLPTPVTQTDLTRIAQIEVTFGVRPFDNSTNTGVQATFDDSVSVRLPFPPPKTSGQNRTVACNL